MVGKTFPFESAPEAVRYLQSGKSVGKVSDICKMFLMSEVPLYCREARYLGKVSSLQGL